MRPLEKSSRNKLEKTVKDAREVAEAGARAALEQMGVESSEAYSHLSEDLRDLRRRLRAHGRQLGDKRDATGKQEIELLAEETAYQQWHRMLFARFLAENDLLMYPDPDEPVAVTIEECEDMAEDEGAKNGWELAARYASRMLPQIFRQDSPVLELELPPEHQQKLETMLADLPDDVFTASDSIGWVYQFWQAKRKDEVNAAGVKIGARELPAVTQLFTEQYMVDFLLDNSLGAWWAARRLSAEDLENAKNEEELRQKASIPGVPLHYLRFVKQEDGRWTPASGTFDGWPENLGELKTLDPCCGSGHFLVSAFQILVPMRMEMEELSARDAVDRVLSENIHGLEIDGRCVELAAFSLALAAWRYPDAGGYRILPELKVACSGLSVRIPKSEWKNVAKILPEKSYVPIALDWLYEQYKEAAFLGSLIDPTTANVASLVDWNDVVPLLNEALLHDRSEEVHESGVVARGLAECTKLLAGKYTWVITNVPYLARGKQNPALQDFCSKHYKDAKNDLATVFLERCLQFCIKGGIVSIVLPQNWLFLTTYKKFREKLLKNDKWHLIARLGPQAFQTPMWDFNVQLITISRGHGYSQLGERCGSNLIHGLDVSRLRSTTEKYFRLINSDIKSVKQVKQMENPDSRIVIDEIEVRNLLEEYAVALAGINTGDYPRWGRNFWEIDKKGDEWVFQQTTTMRTTFDSGLTQIFKWCGGKGEYLEYINSLNGRLGGSWKRGVNVWGMAGVVVSQMRYLPVARYAGSAIDSNISVVIPSNRNHLTALYAFCSSDVFQKDVRKIDQKLNVTNATLSKVPFDLDYWKNIADKKFPKGLPEPHSNDPTQWIFHSHPCDSVVWDEVKKRIALGPKRSDNTVLHVAIARLLGYRWPAEYVIIRPSRYGEKNEPAPEDFRLAPDQDGLATSDAPEKDGIVASDAPDQDSLATVWGMELADEAWELVERAKELCPYADEDGIVCIPAVRGEMNAEDRLENLLAEAYGNEWSPSRKSELLKQADHAGKSMESWLRDKFFSQHCKLFQNRPFIWHIWDGLRDGFAALVNYHKLDYKNLETLIYTYLGDWIRCQRQDMADGIDGAEEKLAAAEALKKRLELILEGEAPYDIFIRWKPIEEQPIGWNPDLNDGVRLNIRPFMTVHDVKKKGAGVLRDKPNIKWDKDRGKDVPSAPWYDLGPEYGGKKGDRINDHHLSLKEKMAAQNKMGDKKN